MNDIPYVEKHNLAFWRGGAGPAPRCGYWTGQIHKKWVDEIIFFKTVDIHGGFFPFSCEFSPACVYKYMYMYVFFSNITRDSITPICLESFLCDKFSHDRPWEQKTVYNENPRPNPQGQDTFGISVEMAFILHRKNLGPFTRENAGWALLFSG